MTAKTSCHDASSASFERVHLGALVRLPLTWMKRVRDRRQLLQLLAQPDYMVRDIGLERADITREGLKPFWRA
jgi:uncharacterized protein YjiS (DUF1127 family)